MPPTLKSASPWGCIDHVTPLGPHAVSVSTSSHGGIWVSPEGLERIPQALRATRYSPGPWFEEDCDWCIPYAFLRLHEHEADPARGAKMIEAAAMMLERYPGAVALARAQLEASLEDERNAATAPEPLAVPSRLNDCPVVAAVPTLAHDGFVCVCWTQGKAGHDYAVWRARWRPSEQAWIAESGTYTDSRAEALADMLDRARILQR